MSSTAREAGSFSVDAGRFLWPILAIVMLCLHLWALEQAPPGAYVDETSIGYNAYSILRTGADEHGVRWPLYFKAFGEYKNPVFIYSLVPLIALFDLSIWTIRLGAALYGLGAALLLGLIVKEENEGKLGWTAGFVIAGSMPWLFALSRVSFEVVSFPFFIALAWWSWLRAVKSRALGWFLLSGSAWGVAIFTYSTARLMVPLLVAGLLVSYCREIKEQHFRPLIATVPFALGLVLLVVWMGQHPGALTARFAEISVAKDSADPLTWIGRFVANYLGYFSPHFLFLSGDANLRHHTGYGGELFLFTFPALIAGIAYACQRRAQASALFALAGFLLFPLAASLTADSGHSLRAANGLPFLIVLIAWGGRQLLDWLRSQRVLVITCAVVIPLEMTSYYFDYFRSYPERARAWFSAGLPAAVENALQRKASNAPLYYSLNVFRDENFDAGLQPYVQFLFFGKLDPPTYRERGLVGFDIHAYKDGMSLPSKAIVLLKDSEEVFSASGKVLGFPNSDAPPSAKLIQQINLPVPGVRNPPAYQIFQMP